MKYLLAIATAALLLLCACGAPPPLSSTSFVDNVEFNLTIPSHAVQYLYSQILDADTELFDSPKEVVITYIGSDDDVDENLKILYSLKARGITYIVLDIKTREHNMFYEQDDFEVESIMDGKPYLVNRTGNRWFAAQDFPHSKSYDPKAETSEKIFLPINDENVYYDLGLSSLVYGDISQVDISGGVATITFDVSQVKHNEPNWAYYPRMEYWYSVSERKATLNLYNIVATDLEKLKKIEALEGVQGAAVSITNVIMDGEEKNSTQLTFYVDDGYNLYGEVPLYGEGNDVVEYIRFWTEPKSQD